MPPWRSWAMPRQVKVTKENTIIVDGAGNSDDIKDRIAQIRSQIETTTSRLRP